MELVSKKNTLLALSAILVVAYGYMAIRLNQGKPKVPNDTFQQEVSQMQNQSNSTEPESSEKDLDSTDFSDLDKELQNIDQELNSAQ